MTSLDIDEALHAADERLAHGSTTELSQGCPFNGDPFRRYLTLARIQNLQSAFRYEVAQTRFTDS
jgi:hypothetical protein